MNVGPSQLSILPSSIQKGSQKSGGVHGGNEQNDKRGSAFGPIYDQLGQRADGGGAYTPGARATKRHLSVLQGLESGFVFKSDEIAYSLGVSIGERAVSFQARPIVGPADTGSFVNLAIEAPLAESSSRIRTAHIELDNSHETLTNSHQAAGQLTTESRTDEPPKRAPVAPNNAGPQTKSHPHTAQISPGKSNPQQAQAQSTRNLPSSRLEPGPDQSGRTTHGSGPQPQLLARAQLFASILASAKEYRVTTRGVELSAADRERLASDIRAALHGLGLPDLPVILTGNTGAK